MAITDVKTIRVFKTYGGSGTKGEYSNTYHALSPGSLKEPNLEALARKIAQAERGMASDKVFFSRAVISTYARKGLVGGSDKPYIVPIAALGGVNLTPDNNGTDFKVLPPEACIVMGFSGGLGRPGRHTYRYSIMEDEWLNSGSGVSLTPSALERCNNAWSQVLDPQFGFPPLVFLTEDEDGQPTDPVTKISCLGYQLRQLTQKKGSRKKGDVFDPNRDDEDDAEREVLEAVEVINEAMANRYSDKWAAVFAGLKWPTAIGGILAAASAAKNALDTDDYGPRALPGGSGD